MLDETIVESESDSQQSVCILPVLSVSLLPSQLSQARLSVERATDSTPPASESESQQQQSRIQLSRLAGTAAGHQNTEYRSKQLAQRPHRNTL